ncbi:hypothetical protein CENSYa_1361 [Cenarchaeum symbiosum A]|uniref:Uncharacterized protein n=1 Tax=Cenarchaeum symbiosum (strain A) TaxID=414004 RepID=A0RXB7_CENSY|nr:hypothetical protein CENSYa_1361 [Cenarchaeum symbiosum A]
MDSVLQLLGIIQDRIVGRSAPGGGGGRMMRTALLALLPIILAASASAHAQTSGVLEDGILNIYFEGIVDVSEFNASRVHLRDGSTLGGGVTLSDGTIITTADGAVLRFDLNGTGLAPVLEYANPRLHFDAGALEYTNGTSFPPAFERNEGFYVVDRYTTGPTLGSPEAIAFSPDGLRMFIGGNDNEIEQHLLNAPYNVSSADENVIRYGLDSRSNQRIGGIAFSPDGLEMFLLDDAEVWGYDLQSAYDLTDAVSRAGRDFNPTASQLTGIDFSDDGTRMFISNNQGDAVVQYDLTQPYNYTSAPLGGSGSNGVGGQNRNPHDVAFTNSGSTMLVLAQDQKVYRYDMNVSFDVTTAMYIGEVEMSQEDATRNSRGLTLSPDGRLMITASTQSSGQVTVHALNTPYGRTTGVFAAYGAVPIKTAQGIAFAADGMSVFAVNGGAQEVTRYDLSAPFNTGNATSISTVSISEVDAPGGIDFSATGETMYVVGRSGVHQYTLDSPYGAISGTPVLNPIAEADIPRGVDFSPDGTIMLVAQFSGGASSSLHRYDLSTPFDVSTAAQTDSLDILSVAPRTQGLAVSPDGTKMLLVGNPGYVQRYEMSEPYNLSSAVIVDALDVGGQQSGTPRDIELSADGTRMFITTAGTSNSVHGYELTGPYDITPPTEITVPVGSGAFDIGIDDAIFSPDGTRMYVINNGNVEQYSFELPFSLMPSFSVNNPAISETFVPDFGTYSGIAMSDNGTELYLLDGFTPSILRYKLATPFDISDTTLREAWDIPASVITAVGFGLTGMDLSEDGVHMYLAGETDVYKVELGTPFSLSPAPTSAETLSLRSGDDFIRGVAVTGDGRRLITIDAGDDFPTPDSRVRTNTYDMSTPHDLTTAAFQSGEETVLDTNEGTGITFAADSRRLFFTGGDNGMVRQLFEPQTYYVEIVPGASEPLALSAEGTDSADFTDRTVVVAMRTGSAADAPVVDERASAERTVVGETLMSAAADAPPVAEAAAISATLKRSATDEPMVDERVSADSTTGPEEVMRTAADALSIADRVAVSAMAARPASDAPTVAERASAVRTSVGVVLMRAAADAPPIAEGSAISATFARPASDAPLVTELVSADRTIDSGEVASSAADALSIADGVAVSAMAARPASDAPTVAEMVSADRTIDSGEVASSAADALSIADGVAVSAMAARPASDAPTIAEMVSADRTVDSGTVMRAAADALSIADGVAVSAMAARPASDAPTIAEMVSADRTIDSGEVASSAADALSIADSVAVSAMSARPASDALPITEGTAIYTTFPRPASDAPLVAERASADRTIDSGTVMRAAADALSIADSVAVSAMAARPATDAPTVAERASADRTIDSGTVMRAAADALSIADSVAVSAMAARPATDAPAVAERASADRTIDSGTVMRAAADAPSPSDSTDIILSAVRAAADAPAVSESNNVDLSGEIRDSDAPEHEERVSLGTGLDAADAPLVSERIDGMRMGMIQAADAPMASDGVEVMQDGIIQKTVAPSFTETVVRSVSLGTGDAPAVSERETSMGMILLGASDAPGITDSAHTTPTVRSVSANSTAEKENGTVAITITFSEPVNVTSAPQLLLEVGADNVTAEYASGSGTTELVFNYTVLDGHNSPDLSYVGTDALVLGSGSITAVDDGTPADLTLPQPGSNLSLSGSSDVVIDTEIPSIAYILATGNYTLVATISERLDDIPVNTQVRNESHTGYPMVDIVAGNNLLITTNHTLFAQNITVQFTNVMDPAGNTLATYEYNLTGSDTALIDNEELVMDDDRNLLVIHDGLPDEVRVADQTVNEPLILNLEQVKSPDNANATLPSDITVTRGNATIVLPINLTLSGFNGTQQIIIQNSTRTPEVDGTPRETSVDVGLPDVDLLLGMPVEIGLDGKPGDLGYRINSTDMTTEINRCDGNSPARADVHRANGGACLVNTGDDFTILTYGLSTFGLFIPTPEPVSPPTPAPLPRRGGGGGGGGGSILSGPSVESSASLGFASGGQDALESPSGILLSPAGTLVITPEIESAGFTTRVFGMEVILYGAGGQEGARVKYSAVPVLLNSEQCSGASHSSDRVFACDGSSVISEEQAGYLLDASDQLSLEIPLEGEFEGTMSVMLQDSRGILLLSHDRAVYRLSTGQSEAAPEEPRADAGPGDGPGSMQEPLQEAAEPDRTEEPMDPEPPEPGVEEPRAAPAGPDAEEPRAAPAGPDEEPRTASPGPGTEPAGLLDTIVGWFRSLFGG